MPIRPPRSSGSSPLRQRGAGTYRIVFRIYEDQEPKPVVRVVAIRHGAREMIPPEELDEIV